MKHEFTIDRPIKPTDVSIFYEEGKPYLKYKGVTKNDIGLTFEVNIPKIDLEINDIVCCSECQYLGNKEYSFMTSFKQNVCIESNSLMTVKILNRTCSKEDLEKELGYKLNIV